MKKNTLQFKSTSFLLNLFFIFLFLLSTTQTVFAVEEPSYGNLGDDIVFPLFSTLNVVSQTLGRNLSGTLQNIDIKSNFDSLRVYGMTMDISLYECDDDTYGGKFNGLGPKCAELFRTKYSSTTYSGNGQPTIQTFLTPPAVLDPLKYYLFKLDGYSPNNLLVNGSTVDSVEGRCYELKLRTRASSCGSVSDLYFNLYGVTKSSTTPPVLEGNSNVLFIPGFESSRLYRQKGAPCLNCEDQLWEPNGNSDVEDLYLNTDGTSKNTDIYTRDIIKETNTPVWAGFIGQNIYKSFSNTMDTLVTDKKMAEWKAFPYDWRQSPDDVVVTPQKIENNETVSLVDTLEKLVLSSKSGKVTIIAHSNGGLVAKALLKKLQDDKTARKSILIDKVDVLMLIASPQLGTPSAIPAILHGYDHRIGFGIILSEAYARELGRNMSGAYGLLPSQKYIQTVPVAPVTFIKTALGNGTIAPFISAYGSTTDTYLEFQNFLKGSEGRAHPEPNDILSPIKLSSNLLSKAENLHTSIDNWIPPATLKVIQIAGWGIDTVAGFEYIPKHTCIKNINGAGCTNKYVLDQQPIFTIDGDKTVVTPSALSMGGEKWWVDINKYNIGFKINREHKNILEINPVINIISNTLQKTNVSSLSYLSTTTPINTSNRLRLAVHSPVTLTAYDSQGNRTGKICSENSDFCYIEENIPNSSYMEFGEGKYLNLPEENLKNIQLVGTGTGTFTFESEKVLPSGEIETSTFKDIPVTTQTRAEIALNITTNKPELKLDIDGNGIIDTTLQPKAEFDPIAYLETMKKVVGSLNIVQIRKEILYRKIEKIIARIQAGKVPNASEKVLNVLQLLNEKTGGATQTHAQGGRLSILYAKTLYAIIFTYIDLIK